MNRVEKAGHQKIVTKLFDTRSFSFKEFGTICFQVAFDLSCILLERKKK